MTTPHPRRKRPARAATAAVATHPDAAELRPGQSIALLQDLHLLTLEGQLNQDARRKLKLAASHMRPDMRGAWRCGIRLHTLLRLPSATRRESSEDRLGPFDASF